MKHLKAFEDALDTIHSEGRYRVFVDLHRHKGEFPKATARFEHGEREIIVWCCASPSPPVDVVSRCIDGGCAPVS
jgi:uncharacterized protein YecE (DUF72 family)